MMAYVITLILPLDNLNVNLADKGILNSKLLHRAGWN